MASEAKHTPGPWGWYGSANGDGRYYLATIHGGRRTVMSFRRSGTQSAQPEFQVDSRMVPASELVRFDVDPTVKGKTAGKASPSVYRMDFSEIDHPDARLIAAAPKMLEALQKIVALANREFLNGGDAKLMTLEASAAIAKATAPTAMER